MEESFPLRNYRLLNRSLVLSRENNNNNHSGVHHPTLSSSVSSSSTLSPSFVSSDNNNVQNLNPNLPEDLYNLDLDFNNLALSSRNENISQQQQQHLASYSCGLITTINHNRAGVMIGHSGGSSGGYSSPLTIDSFDSVLPINPTYQSDLLYPYFLERRNVESVLQTEQNGGGMYTNSQSHLGYPAQQPLPFDNAFYAASPAAGGLNSSTIFTGTANNNNNGLINYLGNNREPDIINYGEFATHYFTNGNWNQQQGGYYNFTPLEKYKGKIHLVAKEQRGCKFLQEILEIGNHAEIMMIYSEIKNHVVELMKDPFANYLIQKFYQLCKPDQITQLLIPVVSGRFSLIELCQNTHGTRAMQKLLGYLTTPEQRTLLVSALAYITVPLVKSSNGSHVIQHCLKSLPIQDTKHILNVVAENCLQFATDRSGCRVLQQCIFICITQAEGESGNRILAEIVSNALFLSQDLYGNYVVQFVIGNELPRVTNGIINQLRGRFVSLSMDKHGSNVVEKCMKESSEEEAILIIKEIIYDQNFMTVVQDAFGNYVAQSALAIAKGSLRQEMVNLIQMHYSSLHNNPHGKRILAKARALKK